MALLGGDRIMREVTCCFTGHRQIPVEKVEIVKTRLREALISAVNSGYRYFGAGGALGFDTLAANEVLALKDYCLDVRLILVLPCKSQARGWKSRDIEVYEAIKKSAYKVEYISENYYNGCMHKRNRHLVDNSSMCICYLTKKSGGTHYTVHYTEEHGLNIINLADSR